jgi:hypothetical protein
MLGHARVMAPLGQKGWRTLLQPCLELAKLRNRLAAWLSER